jgi:dihydrofolate reductase
MTRVVADISMSLDGFVTGPHPSLEHGLGVGGEPLHVWAIASDDPVDKAALETAVGSTGVVVMGRRLFDIVDGPNGWDDEIGYGARSQLADEPPVLVVTHAAPKATRLGDRFTFMTGHLDETLDAARELAGGKDVVVMGGGDLVRQTVDQGLAEMLRIHLAPVLLGSGTPLFTGGSPCMLEQVAVTVSPHATHLTYRLR